MRGREGSSISAAPEMRSAVGRRSLALLSATAAALLAIALLGPAAQAAHLHEYTTSFGPDGTSATTFERPGALAIDPSTHTLYVAEINGQSIDKFDAAGQPVAFSSTPGSNKITGIPFRGGAGESQIAVGPANHDIYAASFNTIKAFSASGQPDLFTAGPGIGTNQLSGFGELLGTGVDSNGDIYAADYYGTVSVFAPTGALLTSFSVARAGNVAIDSQGNAYVLHWNGGVEKFVPSAYPVTGSTTWTSAGEIDTAFSATVAIEPETDHVFVDHSSGVTERDTSGTVITEFASTAPGDVTGSLGVAIDRPSATVYVSDAGSNRVKIYQAVVVPDLTVSDATDATPHTISVHGSADPAGGGDISACTFEYGTDTKYELGSIPCDATLPYTGPTTVQAEFSGLSTLTTYHYRLAATGPDGTARSGDHTFVLAPELPIVDGTSVTGVTDSEAVAEAQINPNAGPTIYRFQYGTTQSYGQQTLPSESIGNDEVDHVVTNQLVGLEPGKVYHLRVAATNFAGTVFGPDRTFTTLGPPELGLPSISNLGPSSATLTFQVNPSLSPTRYHVELGPTSKYGSQTGDVTLADTENVPHEVTVQLSGLSPQTTYHLRAVATNGVGSAGSLDQTLTTAAEPPHEEAPPPPVKCKKGFVKRKGKCVKPPHHRKHHRKAGSHA